MTGPLSYDDAGATAPADPVWGPTPPSYRCWEGTVVLEWGVKTRSGFAVLPADAMPVRSVWGRGREPVSRVVLRWSHEHS